MSYEYVAAVNTNLSQLLRIVTIIKDNYCFLHMVYVRLALLGLLE